MLLRFAALLLALAPAVASAGLRAVYVPKMGDSTEVKVADNGDIDADLGGGRRLVVRGERSYVVTERLTGPVVHRLEDLAALAGDRWIAMSRAAPESGAVTLVPLGPTTVHGRSGTGYGWPKPPPPGEGPRQPLVVLSDDPALRPLAAVMRKVWNAETLLILAEHPDWPAVSVETLGARLRMLDRGAPLKYGDEELQTLERRQIRLAEFDPADGLEPLDALRARRESERREEPARSGEADISRAAFAEGRLWLVDGDGRLSSLADGEANRRMEAMGEPVIDICAGSNRLVAITGERDGRQWRLWSRVGGAWRADRPVRRADDVLVALSCGGGRPVLLTTRRVIDPARARRGEVTLSKDLNIPRVNAVMHETRDHLFVGLNRGEWGGGLIRIERRTGRWIAIERNETGDGCDGPLNTNCDPVHAIATIPWKPDCVAAAIGLIHFFGHGRIVEVCGTSVEPLFTQAADRHRRDSQTLEDVAKGRYGSVAFFGLEAAGGALLAVGHDGLYRIEGSGRASYRRWPRFKEVGGLLVSFELPDVVLVLTTINRRASISGAAPILVVR